MRTNRHAALLTALTLLATGWTIAGCADDPVVSGSVTARYTLLSKSCDEFRLGLVRAQVIGSDGTLENEATAPCARSGEIVVDPVLPGTYTVRIDGLSTDTTPRATHGAEQAGVRVSEDTAATTEEMVLTQNPGSVHVRWTFSDGLPCIDNSVVEIVVQLFDFSNNTIGDGQTVACDNSFNDPQNDDQPASGVLFDDILIPEGTDFDVVVRGFDAVGGTRIREGTEVDQTLDAGERKTITVTLEPTATP